MLTLVGKETKEEHEYRLAKEALKDLKKWVRKGYGKKCPDFELNCIVCQMYLALDIFGDAIELQKSM